MLMPMKCKCKNVCLTLGCYRQQAYDVEGYDAGGVSGAAAGSPAGSDADVFGNSPMSISSRKRACSSATTTESPS
jgi:hypothetical protein